MGALYSERGGPCFFSCKKYKISISFLNQFNQKLCWRSKLKLCNCIEGALRVLDALILVAKYFNRSILSWEHCVIEGAPRVHKVHTQKHSIIIEGPPLVVRLFLFFFLFSVFFFLPFFIYFYLYMGVLFFNLLSSGGP